jgi:hypothetical protein
MAVYSPLMRAADLTGSDTVIGVLSSYSSLCAQDGWCWVAVKDPFDEVGHVEWRFGEFDVLL